MPPRRGHILPLGNIAKVMARRKTLARAAQDNATDRVVIAQINNMLAQLLEQRDGQRV